MSGTRKQLSMYVPENIGVDIENIRRVVDPVQHSLIPAHITLCREDELHDLAAIQTRLCKIPFNPLTLQFGKPEIFSCHGLLLNCIGGDHSFKLLREYLLASTNTRNQQPHITLAHPRNPKATGNSLQTASRLPDKIEITFPAIFLIEQEGSAPWRVLQRYSLSADTAQVRDTNESGFQ